MTAAEPPTAQVLAAFGLPPAARPLAGGQGSAWLAGCAVLKPLDMAPAALRWQAELLARLDGHPHFRVSPPLPASSGALIVAGWTAWRYEPGQQRAGRWADIIAVGRRFHAAVAAEARPAFLDQRQDRWAIADRVAWGELAVADVPAVRQLPPLSSLLRPLTAASQLVHGDLTGNVLFAEGRPPLIIDLSPYWRPVEAATAIVVADALVFEGATGSLIDGLSVGADFGQYLLRALIFRAVTDQLARPDQPARPARLDPYLPAVELAAALCRR